MPRPLLVPLACLASLPRCTPEGAALVEEMTREPPPPFDPLKGVERTYASGCRLTGAAAPPPKVKLSRYLARTAIQNPIQMLPANDGSGRVFLVAQAGRILVAERATPDGSAAEWLDIRGRVASGGEAGLLSMAFDPHFKRNGRFYVNYTTRRNGPLQTVISRFRVPEPPMGSPDPASEQVLLLIHQPYDNHNGGQIAFGPDGHLYIGMGDGGSGGDPVDAGQRMDTLLGKVLRIDVGTDDASYRTPADNPFYTGQEKARGAATNNAHCADGQGRPASCGEIWALGLRNPWRFSFDPVGGALWAGDVGQGAKEEIDIIERGRNYGWRCMEGESVYSMEASCQMKRAMRAFTPPIHDYPRGDGVSVTGGHVYRGRAMPALYGTYVFGDFGSGTVWGLAPDPSGVWRRTTLATEAGRIAAFGLDDAGEIYVVNHTGEILRIEAAEPGMGGTPGWPETLLATGCMSDLTARRPLGGALTYTVNVPLWSDGSAKERALFLPQDKTLGFRDAGTWEVPDGTIFMKTFVLGARPIETRFLVWTGGAVRGATYRWNEGGTDAQLLNTGVTATIAGRAWSFPSRSECIACHTRASGHLLGMSTVQLNREHDLFGTGRVSQIDALSRVGYLTGAPRPAAELARFPEPGDEGAPASARARAYLDANCAHCHMPGGLSNATIDLRARTPLGETRACDVAAQHGDLGVPGARIIAPGKPEQSTLWLRMASTDPAVRMPNLASNLPDEQGLGLVRAWIEGLKGCEQD